MRIKNKDMISLEDYLKKRDKDIIGMSCGEISRYLIDDEDEFRKVLLNDIKVNPDKYTVDGTGSAIINYMFKDITPEQLDKAHKIKTKEFNDKLFPNES